MNCREHSAIAPEFNPVNHVKRRTRDGSIESLGKLDQQARLTRHIDEMRIERLARRWQLRPTALLSGSGELEECVCQNGKDRQRKLWVFPCLNK